ncbi:MAG: phosphoribosylformylglycinamidine synthase subunit PurL [Firmicutes bacterium]|nr:phosphoribosylformylglycinamidine synthase subunit PurL [Candidatus Fermentithermobacillaceae bacterium]
MNNRNGRHNTVNNRDERDERPNAVSNGDGRRNMVTNKGEKSNMVSDHDGRRNDEKAKDGAWRELGLKDDEYRMIVEKLGREPNFTELGMFAVMWSEHCGYKHSKNLLKKLPVTGPRILVGPGENAGVVDIGDGLGVAFKIESHNHPCAVEPYEAAGTGVGGIVRDILAMGSRPVALAGSFRFGPPDAERSRFLFCRAIAGATAYGDALGIPTISTEIMFAQPYANNPLCNVLCAGILRHDQLRKGLATGVGNVVMIAGNSTGRDGIHGCTFASDELGDVGTEGSSHVASGDPLMGKGLIEACLEMMAEGLVLGIQDMGAAGITSSGAETAARAGTGLAIEVSKVPVREEGMTPYEIMLSESQERMLLIVTPENLDRVTEIGKKWDLHVAEIGVVNDSGNLQVYANGVKVADVPVDILTRAPVYEPESKEPAYLEDTRRFSAGSVPVPEIDEFNAILTKLLASPNIVSKQALYDRFAADRFAGGASAEIAGEVGTRMGEVSSPREGGVTQGLGKAGIPEVGVGVIRVEGTSKGLAVTTRCNGRLVYLNPRAGTQWAVAQAARALAATGAVPLAITNCLNFGNPEKPEIFWQLKQSVEGMAEACSALDTPVAGGNVSLYNETQGEPVYPTPVIGMIGLLDDARKAVTPGFKAAGHKIAVIGKIYGDNRSLHGSEYLRLIHGVTGGDIRYPDLEMEKRIVKILTEGARQGLFASAHSVALGGLAVALAQSCIWGQEGARGADIRLGALHGIIEPSHRPDGVLFGESDSVVIVSFAPEHERHIEALCRDNKVPFTPAGTVTADGLVVKRCSACLEAEIIKLGYQDMVHAYYISV